MRKAKEYRTKNSYNNGSSNQHSRGTKGEHFKLSDVSHSRDDHHDKSASTAIKSSSEENILQGAGIMKSITYSVQVDEERGQTRRRNDSFEDSM